MKWGIRRAEKKGKTYTYKSHGQKKWEKKMNKAVAKNKSAAKIKKTTDKYELFRERDRNRQEYARTANLGKSFCKLITMGPIGMGTYSRYRASGDERVSAFLKSNIVVSTLGAPISILTSRGSEFKSARQQIRSRKYK